MTRSALERAGLTVSPKEATHPAVIEAAHIAQYVLRTGPPAPERLARLGAMVDRARSDITASSASALPWPDRLTAPGPHLERSVARAVKSIPSPGGEPGTPHGSAVVGWREHEEAVIRETAALLAANWPGAYAELRQILLQIALLDGPAIDGFTDFTVHGAVFIRRSRLAPDPDGLPGAVRLAEALVHEGAHTRCNAASVAAQPFLRPLDDDGPMVPTPLRLDPRPLTGLFQQMVVLARSVLLYRHLLAGDTAGSSAAATVRARHGRLAFSAADAVRTMTEHRDMLTDHGRAVLEDTAEVARVRVR
ncbi:HEXXH motif-containing putative peptide modification protein [Streptomyces sp. NBC_01591]|uniref:aKG-HExxH-type peptide beta-hydroxylase n=1 Tax=Streptomyces sp. NBC_01591 TaxID=2975888 RepID=UPI002DD97C5F|nr:HEXXH motif-containing putative peptide modification protein [Streptomyces sp. NBC_01591]WSD73565.1 HEXXH motif-containing putative peptide modification protein [Streptomyces sp. NBC_01591]